METTLKNNSQPTSVAVLMINAQGMLITVVFLGCVMPVLVAF